MRLVLVFVIEIDTKINLVPPMDVCEIIGDGQAIVMVIHREAGIVTEVWSTRQIIKPKAWKHAERIGFRKQLRQVDTSRCHLKALKC